MKKIFIITVLTMIMTSGNAFGQATLPSGRTQINIGTGFSDWGIPIYVGLDYAIQRDITLGAEFSFNSYREYYKNVNYHHNILGFSGNANYHFNSLLNIPNRWDFYAGLGIGFFVWSSPTEYLGSHSSGLGLGAQIGGRFALTNRISLNLELGGGNAFSGGKFGITLKI